MAIVKNVYAKKTGKQDNYADIEMVEASAPGAVMLGAKQDHRYSEHFWMQKTNGMQLSWTEILWKGLE